MAKQIQFQFTRNATPGTIDPEVIGYEATVNVPGWPTPQVTAVLLDAPKIGTFLGDPGATGTLELRHEDADGLKSETPFTKTFTLPTNLPPQTPGDVFDISIEGEVEVAPPGPPDEPNVDPDEPPVEGQVAGTPKRKR